MSVTPSPSDLESSLPIIKGGLIGYRNLLSYVSSLGLEVIPYDSIQPETWTQIDSGAFSTVWRASSSVSSGSVVAVKQPIASFTCEKSELENELQNEALSSMIQELRILAHPQLKNHPNLPHAIGVFFQEEENPPGIRPSVVLELALSDLHSYLQNISPNELGGKEMARLCSQVASGICALHAYGLVHGDIKPKNTLLFMRDGQLTAAVGDLGTCGVVSQTSGTIPGTRSFYAPEVFERSPFHHLANQPARDIYSFGILVLSILTRCSRDPFPYLEQFNIQHDDSRCISYLLDQTDKSFTVPELEHVIRLTVKSNPAERAQIFDVIEGLETMLGERKSVSNAL
jgi:serine/threonine protein kinase